MNTSKQTKAKKKVRRNELIYFTTIEVFGKPVHVPNANAGEGDKSYAIVYNNKRVEGVDAESD